MPNACLERTLDHLLVAAEAVEGGQLAPVEFTRELGELDPRACLDESVLEREYPPLDAAAAAAADELGDRLAALRYATEQPLETRRASARALLASIAPLDGSAVHASLVAYLAELAVRAGDSADARTHYGALVDIATRANDRAMLSAAWHGQAVVALQLDLDLDDTRWAIARERELLRERGTPPRALGHVALIEGLLAYLGHADLATAEVGFRTAVDAFERAGQLADWDRALALRNLASVLTDRGQSDAALALHQRAAALEGATPGHDPEPPSRRYNEARTLVEDGQLDAAQTKLDAALDHYLREYGPRSIHVADCLGLRAKLEVMRGQLERAAASTAAADAIYRDCCGVDHPSRFEVLSWRGTIAFWRADHAAAVDAFERALLIADARPGGVLPVDRALAQANLGEALTQTGEFGRAQLLLEQACATLERQLGAGHPDLAIPNKALGAVYLERADPERARIRLDAALVHLGDTPTLERADANWLLAQALAALEDPAAARARAELAHDDLLALGDEHGARRQTIEQWLEGR